MSRIKGVPYLRITPLTATHLILAAKTESLPKSRVHSNQMYHDKVRAWAYEYNLIEHANARVPQSVLTLYKDIKTDLQRATRYYGRV